MNCDCVKDLERKLAEHFRAEAGDDVRADCDVGIDFSGKYAKDLVLPIRFTVRGSKSRKFSKSAGHSTVVFASYCPFCGTSTIKNEPAATTATKEQGNA